MPRHLSSVQNARTSVENQVYENARNTHLEARPTAARWSRRIALHLHVDLDLLRAGNVALSRNRDKRTRTARELSLAVVAPGRPHAWSARVLQQWVVRIRETRARTLRDEPQSFFVRLNPSLGGGCFNHSGQVNIRSRARIFTTFTYSKPFLTLDRKGGILKTPARPSFQIKPTLFHYERAGIMAGFVYRLCADTVWGGGGHGCPIWKRHVESCARPKTLERSCALENECDRPTV